MLQQIVITIALVVFSNISFAMQENTGSVVNEPETKQDTLRPRNHWLNWRYLSTTTKVETTSGSSKTKNESKSGELSFGYLYNWGRFQAGGNIGSTISDDGTTKATLTALSFIGQLNFIENVPNNNFIPFARFEISRLTSEISATSTTKGSGNGTAFSVGAYYLPFGELFAVEFGLSLSAKADLSYENSNVKQTLDLSSFYVGWSIAF